MVRKWCLLELMNKLKACVNNDRESYLVDLNQLMREYLESILQQMKRIPNNKFFPSAALDYMRKQYFMRRIKPVLLEEDRLYTLLRYQIAGDIIQDNYIDKMFQFHEGKVFNSVEIEKEFKLHETVFDPIHNKEVDIEISGRIDDIGYYDEEKEIVLLVEVKTKRKILEKYSQPKYVASENNIAQLMIYMKYMNVETAYLLYVDRGDLMEYSAEVSFNQEVYDGILSRFGSLYGYLEAEIIPPSEAKMNKRMNWMCNYCFYKNICDVADKEDINKLDDLEKRIELKFDYLEEDVEDEKEEK